MDANSLSNTVAPHTRRTSSPPAGSALVCGESAATVTKHVRAITDSGHECVIAQNVERARWLSSVRNFRLVVLLGQTAQWSRAALSAVRPGTVSPILVLSPQPATHARLLDLGADTVVDAHCEDDLLRAACGAVVRRAPSTAPTLRYLEADGLRLDLWSRTTARDGQFVDLSPTEFDVLHFLMTHAQVVVRHHAIIKAVWSWKYADDRNALRIHVNRLRRKLGDQSYQPRYIRCMRGTGYSFLTPVSEYADEENTTRSDQGADGTALLLEGHLRTLSQALLSAGTRKQAGEALVRIIVSAGLCDAAAVFEREAPASGVLRLVTHAGMPSEWVDAVATGVPVGTEFVSGDTITSREIRNYTDVRKLANRYGPTARLLRAAKLPVLLSIPLSDRHGVWGQLGCARRSDSAFTPVHCMVLEAAGYLLGALFTEDARQAGASAAPAAV